MTIPGRTTQVDLSCGSERMKLITGWRLAAVGIGLLAFFSFSPTASATAIGPFNEANCGGGGVTVSETQITWATVGPVSGCIVTGIGTDVTSASNGTLLSGVTGSILSLTAGGSTPVDSFMTFQGTTLDFVLDGFVTPSTTNGTNCSSTTTGQTCVVFAGSPFILTNLGSDTGVSLTAFGTVTDGAAVSEWEGSFTTQLNMTPGAIQTTESGGGSIQSTQSGQFNVSQNPEPASWIMMAGGLTALALIAKRRKTRA